MTDAVGSNSSTSHPISYYQSEHGNLIQLTCSMPNASRPGGGTSYYCLPRSNINFNCELIDAQIAQRLEHIQVSPQHLPAIRTAYTHDLAEALGHLKLDDREQFQEALKLIDQEEARALRLYTTGKVSEGNWDKMWKEWQDRRAQIRLTMETVDQKQQMYITNLDAALEMISKMGLVYNALQRSEQKELLRHVVERVVIDPTGCVTLKLRAPFAYLNDLAEQVRLLDAPSAPFGDINAKTGRETGQGFESSDNFLSCWCGG